ncbi:restriction endonuclease subunit S [Cellulosimicrobium funkei]|uniref:restriction endonuclease subunit S n=1 Tax=Cellulosimicrobium funkei TaxID=264251 RepID=UPI0020408FE1|nr:restriction endonuclease subunit S [Cellulosimicrobium funkei]MCM3534968.1 restriction endonuclease subunit S [Cellulosimicrobium funkei]
MTQVTRAPRRLGDLVRLTSGQSPSGFRFRGRGTPYYKVDQLGKSSKYLDRTATPYHSEELPSVPAGSVLIAKRGAAISLNRIRVLAEPGFMDTNVMALTPLAGLDSEYLYYWLCHRGLWDIADVTSVPQINNKHINPLEIDLPSLPEQKRIASLLQDADALTASLEEAATKKRAIKQGMMQELLTGRTRLPGFTGDWRLRKIGEFAQVKAGGTPLTSVPRYWGGPIRWMSSGEIHQKRVHEVQGRITNDGLRESSAQMFPADTVLMALAGQGRTRGTVAVSRVELSTNQSIAGIFPSSEHDSDFLYYNLDTRYAELRGESTGDGGRGGLNLTIIKNLRVFMPDVTEQHAIAEMLGDVDDEIAALECRLEATRAIKQGMMQELLTGRTRLVSAEATA